jgi:chromosome segregation ATPase
MAQLKAASDRAKVLEGEHVSLQKRFKDQETKIANLERTSQATRQSIAQVQQRASEWEKRTKELDAELNTMRARLDEADEAKLQADSDLSFVRMQLEEKEKAEKIAKVSHARIHVTLCY